MRATRCRGVGRRGCGRRGERSVCWRMWPSRKPRSPLRVREPRRLPRGLSREESAALLGSFRTWRDRAIAGLMLLSGLAFGRGPRAAGRRCGHRPALGSGDRQGRQGTVGADRRRRRRRDPDLPAGRAPRHRRCRAVRGGEGRAPRAAADARPGCGRCSGITAASAGVPAGHPHALRHSFGTALAEAGVDLSVIQALMGHDHVDSSAAYIHLAPSVLREEFDAARARLRARS